MVVPSQPTREVRCAVVIYGGTSLCVYMSGITRERLRFVRDNDRDNDDFVVPDADLVSTEKSYREVADSRA